MASRIENPADNKFDWLKWLIVLVLLVGGIVANYYYAQQPWPLRALAWLVLLAVVVGVALQTSQGKRALIFARESRIELRKVVWPTRQETMRTTMIIAVVVVIVALLLWMIDGVVVWLIGWLTGQRG